MGYPGAPVKLLIIGDCYVGKTALIERFVNRSYRDNSTTTMGVDFSVTTIPIDNQPVTLKIIDTNGNDRFEVINSSYYCKVDGIMIIFDASKNDSSTLSVGKWMKKVRKYATESVSIVFVGNKMDGAAIQSQAINPNDSEDIPLFFTSAKDNLNVEQAFRALVAAAMRRIAAEIPHRNFSIGRLGSTESGVIKLSRGNLAGRKRKTTLCC